MLLKTDLSASVLSTQAIPWTEEVLGRIRTENKDAPRTIDIDLVLFNSETFNLGRRQIPDPGILEQAFIAVPLAEIDPDFVPPGVGRTLAQIANDFDLASAGMQLRENIRLEPPMIRSDAEAEKTAMVRDPSGSGTISFENHVRAILTEIGEDPSREGLLKTPNRVVRMYGEVTSGYRTDPDSLINDALFSVDYDELVLVKDIDYHSLCEHHLLPFFGRVHVGYIPAGKVIGLSKIPRIVEMFARRLQIQERMTKQIADFIHSTLQPAGVGVVVEGAHMCTIMRGVKKANSRMITSTMLGSFKESAKTRAEFLGLVGLKCRGE